MPVIICQGFRWFKFTLKPPYRIMSRAASYGLFGTLPIGILLSNLDWRQLMTSPRTLFGQIWHISIFGDSRAIRVLMAKYRPFRKSIVFLMKEQWLFRWGLMVLGRQIAGLYGGTIFGGGGARHLGALVGLRIQKFHFFDTFAAA